MDNTEQLQADLAAARAATRRLEKQIAEAAGPDRSLLNLHPAAIGDFMTFAKRLKAKGLKFELFEGYRSPMRQRFLLKQHPPVTRADAWESAHNYGLACDFVWKQDGLWSWASREPWHELILACQDLPLSVPITWDRGHVEHNMWKKIKRHVVVAADWYHNERESS